MEITEPHHSLQWQVQYSRFFHFPTTLSTSTPTSLVPITASSRARLRGTWLSSSLTALLKLDPDFSNSDHVLTLNFLGNVHEEHYISNLNFTWPHVSCMSGFPPRGSRVVFASYRDRMGHVTNLVYLSTSAAYIHNEIQKFALRFSGVGETEEFMTILKELMAASKNFGIQSTDRLVAEISSESDFVPAEEAPYRPIDDWNSAITLYSAANPFESSFNSEVSHQSFSTQTALPTHNVESSFDSLPPSFTSLMMMSSQANLEQETVSLSHEDDLKLQIMRCLDDSSFQDILGKVEQVMSEIGNNMLV